MSGCEFKVGDKVVRIGTDWGNMNVGDIGIVMETFKDERHLYLEGDTEVYDRDSFQLVNEHPNPPHKHAYLIKEWADGATIQVKFSGTCDWGDCPYPTFYDSSVYRVKPSKTPQELEKESIIEEMGKLKERLDKLEVS